MHDRRYPQPAVTASRPMQSGFSLLEVLIALVLLSVGLLGLAALQTASLRGNNGSLTRSLATQNAYSILDSMRANRDNAGNYDVGMTGNLNGNSTADVDVTNWKNQLADDLPGGNGRISTNGTCTGAPNANCSVTITVRWVSKGDPLQNPTNPKNNQSTYQYYSVQTQI